MTHAPAEKFAATADVSLASLTLSAAPVRFAKMEPARKEIVAEARIVKRVRYAPKTSALAAPETVTAKRVRSAKNKSVRWVVEATRAAFRVRSATSQI